MSRVLCHCVHFFPCRFYKIQKHKCAVLTFPFLIFLGLTSLVTTGCSSKSKAVAPRPASTVEVIQAIQRDVPVYGEWVATLDGSINAQIQSHVSGYLVRQSYREGSSVHKNDVLFEIDARPFQATLNQTKAQLAQAQARLSIAEVNVKRDTPLAKEHAISGSQLDTELAAQLEGKAAVQAAEAAVDQATLDLSFTKVRSLVNGVAGIATAQIGNLVSPTSALTTVSQVDPIKVYFSISEQEYLRYSTRSKGTSKQTQDLNSMPLQLVLADGSTYPHPGKVVFTDRQVDPQTGTMRVVGTFSNPGNLLRPGQFGRIRALTGTKMAAVLIPQRCVSDLQGTSQVAVVGTNNKVSIRKVKTGARIGSLWVIEEGLKTGEQVVFEGTSKAADGSTVIPKQAAFPTEGQK
jgi:RND family efflux transporter MFP subunit